jgi:hypothetical protein
MKMKALFASATAALLTACGSVDVAHYAAEKPTLELSSFFTGTIDAWGIFQKRSGEVARRFNVEIEANWVSPNEGTLDERFTYSDGEKQGGSGLLNVNLTVAGKALPMMWWARPPGTWRLMHCVGRMS